MLRRTLIGLIATICLAPALSAGEATVAYKPGAIKAALAAGQTVVVDYFAPWCVTCKAQDRVISALRAENPDYNRNLTFIRVDWDTFRDKPVTTERAIPRRSTLLVLRGDRELGRIVAGTKRAAIKALLDTGLAPDS